jgi:hypothetical protein
VNQWSPEIENAYDELFRCMERSHRHLIAPDTSCVRDAADKGDIELLRLYLRHVDAEYSLRTVRAAYEGLRRAGVDSPADLVTEHGIEMCLLVGKEIALDYGRDILDPIYVLALSLTEQEVNRVVEIVRRGVVNVEDIRELLNTSSTVALSLGEGVL